MQKPNTDMHHTSQLVLVIWGGGNRPYLLMTIVQFFDPACQGKMEVVQINLAVAVRTGYRAGRVSRHADVCCDLPQGHF